MLQKAFVTNEPRNCILWSAIFDWVKNGQSYFLILRVPEVNNDKKAHLFSLSHNLKFKNTLYFFSKKQTGLTIEMICSGILNYCMPCNFRLSFRLCLQILLCSSAWKDGCLVHKQNKSSPFKIPNPSNYRYIMTGDAFAIDF